MIKVNLSLATTLYLERNKQNGNGTKNITNISIKFNV